MKQKLIFLDIDGTLLPPGEMIVPESAVDAIHRARANGHKVFLCTGRNLRMTQPLFHYGFDGFVCSAGGYVGCDGKILVDIPMEPEQVSGLRAALERAGAECTLEVRDETYGGIKMIERFANLFPKTPGKVNSEAERWRKMMEFGMTICPIERYHGEPVYKIVFIAPNEECLTEVKRQYDYILVDCSPSLGMLTVNALAAADSALIPVQAQYLSAKGLEQLLQTVQKVRRQINPKLKIEGILLTMTDSRTIYGQQISNLIRQAYGKHLKVFDQTIPRSVRAAETSTTGKSIFQYDPKGKVAEAYHSIAKGVLADAEKRLKRQFEQLR